MTTEEKLAFLSVEQELLKNHVFNFERFIEIDDKLTNIETKLNLILDKLNAQETDKERPINYYFYRIEYTNNDLKRKTLCGTMSTDYNPIEAFESFKRVHSDKLQLSILSFNLIG